MIEVKYKIGPINNPSDLFELDNFESSVNCDKDSTLKLVRIIDKYSFPEKIPCGLKNCCTPHNYGYLALLNNGKLTNIGNKCGKKIFGIDFDKAEKIFKEKKLEADNRESIRKIYSQLSSYEGTIKELLNLSGKLDKCRDFIKELLPARLDDIIERGRKRDTKIYKTTVLYGREADKHRLAIGLKDPKVQGAPIEVIEYLGEIHYCDFFAKRLSVIITKKIKEPLNELNGLTEDLKSLKRKEIAALSKNINEAINTITEARELANRGLRFFSKENLEKLLLMSIDRNREKDTTQLKVLISKVEQELKDDQR